MSNCACVVYEQVYVGRIFEPFLTTFHVSLQYLSKQNLALREINDSRVKVYEQLEENISELEATNKKLVDEAKEDKSKIKGCVSVEPRNAVFAAADVSSIPHVHLRLPSLFSVVVRN